MAIEALSLFHWKNEVVLQTTSGSVTIHLRTLGGIEDEQRMDAALAASREARAKLEDKKSSLYRNHIAPLISLSRDELVEVIVMLQRGLFVREAQWKVEPRGEPEAPEEQLGGDYGIDVISEPQLEDFLKWQDQKDSLRGELEERRTKWVDEQVAALEEELEGLKRAILLDRAIELHKMAIMEKTYNNEWDYWTVYLGSFKNEDCTKPFFRNVQEVKELPTLIRRQLEAAYLELDIFSRNPEQLKNLS